MPDIQRNGTRIHFEISGSGSPLVLLHSFLCSGAMWGPQLEPIAARHRVINIDLRGHGESGAVTSPFDLYDLVDDVLAVLDHERVHSAVWAGLSIGGMIALRAALTASDRVSGLILLDTHAGSETTYRKLKYQARVSAARVIGTGPLLPMVVSLFFCAQTRRGKRALVREWRGRFAAVPLSTVRTTVAALQTRDSVVARLGEIHVPALVMVGEEDRALPPACSREIAAGLAGASLSVIPGAGHLCTLEQPQAVTAAMRSFLDGQGARASA